MSRSAVARAQEAFRWEPVLSAYERLMGRYRPAPVKAIPAGAEADQRMGQLTERNRARPQRTGARRRSGATWRRNSA